MKKSDTMDDDLKDYFRIRFENKIAIRPRREDCHLAAATRQLAKRHELEEVGKEVERCQAWYKSKMAEVAAGREALEEREKGLKKQVLKFEKFLRENDSKRHRGERKIAEEHQLQTSKDSEIAKLKEMFLHLEDNKVKIQAGVDKHSGFRDFLLKAVESTHEHEEIGDLLSRCDVLWATQQALVQREQQNTADLERETLSIIQHSENLSTTVLRLNNRMSELQLRLDRAQRNVIASENNWTRIKNTAAKQTLLLGQVKMAVFGLYHLCNRYHAARVLDQEEVVVYTEPADQLGNIAEILQDITAVYRKCKQSRQECGKGAHDVLSHVNF